MKIEKNVVVSVAYQVKLEDGVVVDQSTRTACRPLIRDPHTIADLLSYQLISGAIAGEEDVL